MKLTLVSISKKYFSLGERLSISVKLTMGSSETIKGELSFEIGNDLAVDNSDGSFSNAWVVAKYENVSLAKSASKTYTFEFDLPNMRYDAKGELAFSVAIGATGDYSGGYRTAATKGIGTYIVDRTAPLIESVQITDVHPLNPMGYFGSPVQNRSTLNFQFGVVLDSRDPTLTTTDLLEVMPPSGGSTNHLQWNEQFFQITSTYLDEPGIYNWTYTVTDSAGISSSKSGTFEVLAYDPPRIDSLYIQRYSELMDDDGNTFYEATTDGNRVWYTIDATVKSIGGLNTWTLKRVREDTSQQLMLFSGEDGDHITCVDDRLLDDSVYTPNRTIGITIILSDFFETVKRYVEVLMGGAHFHVTPTGVAVGMRSTANVDDKMFQVAEDYKSYFYGGIGSVGYPGAMLILGVQKVTFSGTSTLGSNSSRTLTGTFQPVWDADDYITIPCTGYAALPTNVTLDVETGSISVNVYNWMSSSHTPGCSVIILAVKILN